MKVTAAIVLMAAALAFADNPDTDRSDKNFDAPHPHTVVGTLQKAKDGANRGLNKVDKGLHSGAHKTKQEADGALSKGASK